MIKYTSLILLFALPFLSQTADPQDVQNRLTSSILVKLIPINNHYQKVETRAFQVPQEATFADLNKNLTQSLKRRCVVFAIAGQWGTRAIVNEQSMSKNVIAALDLGSQYLEAEVHYRNPEID